MTTTSAVPRLNTAAPAGSLWRDALYRMARNRAAVISALFLLALMLAAVFAEIIAPYDPNAVDFTALRQPPSPAHLMGTDEIGRDILSRVIFGARVSLTVGIVVQSTATAAGVFLGMIAGYYGGLADMVIMRAVDIMYALPAFLFAVFMVSLLTPSVNSVILTLALVSWPLMARLMRGQVLALRQEDYVLAARALGARPWQIMLFHILPNSLTPLIVQFTLGIATVIMAEAGLSFLGIGIRPPTPTWGGMITKGRDYIRTEPHLALYPGIVLGLTMIAFNFLGDGLRDALDPRMKKS